MRLALVTTYMPPHLGGIERIAANLFHGYRRAGCEIRWVTSRVPQDLPAREGAISRVPTWNAVEERLGVPLPVWGPSALPALREAIDASDAVVVLEGLYLTSALAVLLARRARKPVVVIQNVGFIPYASPIVEGVERLAYATLGRWIFRAASHVVLATPTADRFVRVLMGGRRWSASTAAMGIDTDAFRPATERERVQARAALGLAQDKRVALFACRLVEKKGLPIVLGAAERLPDVRFLVAGDGPLRGLLERKAGNVTALGAVPLEEMGRLYHAADAVLLPSQGEGLPLFVQEAMACGLGAVVSEDEVYAADLVAAGACRGAQRDPAAFGDALRGALAAGAEERARARAYAVERWGLDRTIEHHLAVIAAATRGAPVPSMPLVR
jgi:glycosyltransferase involved in cell wall biosynthesis